MSDNFNGLLCRICSGLLWVAPGGGVYCDNIHKNPDLIESGATNPKS